MLDPHALNVLVHVGAGATALGVGAAPLLTTKGGAAHRVWGKWFVGIGAVVITTAIIGDLLYSPPPALIAATLTAAYQFVGGLRALALKDRGPGLIDALIALTGALACVALLSLMGSGTRSWPPALGYGTVGFLGMVIAYDLSRHAWPGTWLSHVRPIDHGFKMIGAYFAMASAGIGNIFRDFQPWSQIGPSLFGLLVMVVLIGAYVRSSASTVT